MNIFVAFFVLLLLLADSTPPAASAIPLIGMPYTSLVTDVVMLNFVKFCRLENFTENLDKIL